MLGTDLEGLSELALKSSPGAYGMVLLPYLEGERTPHLPHTAGSLHGMRRESMKPEHMARAAVEGMLCGLADALDVLRGRGVAVRRVFLLGAAAELGAVQAVAPGLFGVPVVVPQPAEYAALGAARQAAWAWGVAHGTLAPAPGAEPRPGGQAAWVDPPQWPAAASQVFEPGEELPVGQAVRQQYTTVRDETHPGAFHWEGVTYRECDRAAGPGGGLSRGSRGAGRRRRGRGVC